MLLKKKPSNFLLWFLIIIFTIGAFNIFNSNSSSVNFVTKEPKSDFIGNISDANKSRKVNIRASYEITGENYSIFYSSTYEGSNDFNKSKFREALYYLLNWMIYFSVYFSISQFFVNSARAYLISIFGILCCVLNYTFIQVDNTYLIKSFFYETIKDIPLIQSYARSEAFTKTTISVIFLIILVFIGEEIKSNVRKLKLVKDSKDINA